MHAEALWFVYSITDAMDVDGMHVLEIGSRCVNGGVRRLFGGCAEYVGIDREDGSGVGVVADAREYDGAGRFDLVISTEAMEHEPEPQAIVDCAWRALRSGGVFVVTAVGPGRAAHGCDGQPLLEGEHYAPITKVRMRDMLRGWGNVKTWSFPAHGDVYAAAVRP